MVCMHHSGFQATALLESMAFAEFKPESKGKTFTIIEENGTWLSRQTSTDKLCANPTTLGDTNIVRSPVPYVHRNIDVSL